MPFSIKPTQLQSCKRSVIQKFFKFSQYTNFNENSFVYPTYGSLIAMIILTLTQYKVLFKKNEKEKHLHVTLAL